MGDWNEGYLNYNCYAFSIDLVNWRHPDGSSEYDVSKPVSVIADDVISDLNSLGYWGCKAMTKPSSLPDKYFKLICVRKNTNY